MKADRRPAPLLPGLGGLLRGELSRWVRRRLPLHVAVWTLVVTGTLWYATTYMSDPGWRGFDLLIHVWWIALPLGSIAVAQNALIEGRHDDTLSWLVSKPVSRPAFVLSKIIADSMGIVLPAVALQGAIAWVMLPELDPRVGLSIRQPEAARYLVTMGIETLIVVFFVALTVCVSTIFHNRGPVAGIGLGVWILLWNSPTDVLDRFTIGGLVGGELSGASFKPLAEYLVFERPLDPVAGVAWTAVSIVALSVVAIGIFRREQF